MSWTMMLVMWIMNVKTLVMVMKDGKDGVRERRRGGRLDYIVARKARGPMAGDREGDVIGILKEYLPVNWRTANTRWNVIGAPHLTAI